MNLNKLVPLRDNISQVEFDEMVKKDKVHCSPESFLENGNRIRSKDYNSNTLSKSDIVQGFRNYRSQLDNNLNSDEERVLAVKQLIGEVDTVDGYDSFINSHIMSKAYAERHGNLSKSQPLSEHDPFSKGLITLEDYIFKATKKDELNGYTWLSNDAQEKIIQRERYINYEESDFNKGKGKGISEDMLDSASLDHNQKEILLKRLSEKVKRKQRQISDGDLYKYPELLEMKASIILLQDELGVTGEEKDIKKEEYIHKVDKKLEIERKKAYQAWEQGKPRIDLSHLYHWYCELNTKKEIKVLKNPRKLELIRINSVTKPLSGATEEGKNELERKFQSVLDYYGKPKNGLGQYTKVKKLINEVGYEMHKVREQLVKPIESRGYKPKVNAITFENSALNIIRDTFDMSNPKHVYSLLSFQTESEKVHDGYIIEVDEEGNDSKKQKQIRISNYFPVYSMLKDKYGNRPGSEIYLLLKQFNEAINEAFRLGELSPVEMDIVAVVKQEKGYSMNDKRILDKHPYMRAVNYIKEVHNVEMSVRDITYALKNTISKRIAHAYLDQVEVDKYRTKTCTCCGKDKLANERNFSPDKKGKHGLKAICKVCAREIKKAYK
ncbi:hypothetical protein V7138_15065 [Bacillus sp. JJ1533]|uniref:hypothetical protein n=1 Tax=Bacillus sp. JJ1533 TaxID=3122959 RepID=UPI002FFF31EB